jgi:hypothetical protein
MASAFNQVYKKLESYGLLLKQDKEALNVVTILTGEKLSTSWWSHPKSKLIFSVLSDLDDHPDVLIAKLLHGKDTLIHRTLWPHFLAVVKVSGSRLRNHAFQIHTESGRHETLTEPWSNWAKRYKAVAHNSVPESKKILEDACVRIGAPIRALPWHS